MGSLRVGHDWATSLSLFIFMHWRRKWQPTPVFLPGESQGRQQAHRRVPGTDCYRSIYCYYYLSWMVVVRLLEIVGRQAQSKMIVRPKRGSGGSHWQTGKAGGETSLWDKGKVRYFRLGCQRDSRRAEGAVATSQGMRMYGQGRMAARRVPILPLTLTQNIKLHTYSHLCCL